MEDVHQLLSLFMTNYMPHTYVYCIYIYRYIISPKLLYIYTWQLSAVFSEGRIIHATHKTHHGCNLLGAHPVVPIVGGLLGAHRVVPIVGAVPP